MLMATRIMCVVRDFIWHWKRHWSDAGYVLLCFGIALFITNIAYRVFGFRLIDIFESALDTFHHFLHLALTVLVLSWLSYLCFFLTWLASCILPFIEPWFPKSFPGWLSDLMLLSVVLERAFISARVLVPADERDLRYRETTPEMNSQIEQAHGILNWPHRITHWLTTFIWKSINVGTTVLTTRVGGLALPVRVVKITLETLAAAVFMWGFIHLIGYGINVIKAGHLTHIPVMKMRKRLWQIFWFSLFTAGMVAAILLLINGWVIEFRRPP